MEKNHHDYWKTFYELLTKNYIEFTFEPIFNSMIKSECPDFQTKTTGLEIVTAVSETQNALNSLLRKYMNKKKEAIPESLLNNLGFNKTDIYQDKDVHPLFYIPSLHNGRIIFFKALNGDLLFVGQIGFIPSDEFNSKMIVEKINEKINKLNSNYELFSRNVIGVYIDYPIITEETTYQEEVAKLMQDQIEKELFAKLEQHTKMFDVIYICFPDIVYKYCVSSKAFVFKILDSTNVSLIVNKTKTDIKSL